MFQNGFILNEKYQLINKISENEIITFWNVKDLIENEKSTLAITKSKSVSIIPGFGSITTLNFREIEINNLDFNTLEEFHFFILPFFENGNLQSKIDKNELFYKEIHIVKLINQCTKIAVLLTGSGNKLQNFYIPSNIFIDSNNNFFFVKIDSDSKEKSTLSKLVYKVVNGIEIPSNDISLLNSSLKIELNLFYLEILNNKLSNDEIISKTDFYIENGFWKKNIEKKSNLTSNLILISVIFFIFFLIINGNKTQNIESPIEKEEEKYNEPIYKEPVLNPEIDESETENLKIIKVEFTNKYTIVSYVYEVDEEVFSEKKDSSWLMVDKSTIITEIDSQKSYKLLKSENINIDEKLYFTKKTKFLHYKLFFEKVDSEVKYVNIIEKDCENNCFNFYGIKITNSTN